MANQGNFPQKNEPNPSTSRFDTSSMGKTAQESATGLKDKAQDAMSSLKSTASDLASTATDKARAAVNTVSEQASNLASNIGDQAQSAMHKVEDGWEAGRQYISEHGIQGMASDVSDLVRRYPLPALALGVCCGFFLARTMRD